MKRVTCWIVLALTSVGRLSAQEAGSPSPNEPKSIPLTLAPAAEPKPALKHLLLPPLIDRKPGNAAQLYMKCMLRFTGGEFTGSKAYVKLDAMADMPLEKLPRPSDRGDFASWESALQDVDMAARRDYCDWDLAIRDGKFYELLLPEVQNMRMLGRFVAVRTRLAIADGKYDEAIRSLQTGYAMSRHVAEGPTLINALVGMAIAGMMNEQLTTLIQRPDAPNLYWALTSLPQPFIGTLKGIEAERDAIPMSYPALRDLDNPSRSAKEWERTLSSLLNDMAYMSTDRESGSAIGMSPGDRGLSLVALAGYTRAKNSLIAGGREAALVEQMPVAQVIAIFTMERYNEIRDDMTRWHYLPYWQARAKLDEAEARLAANHEEIIPLARISIPALKSSLFASARLDRQIGMLRTIEALRLYAANDDGRWPRDLAAVTEVPLPFDATTGEAFQYRLDGVAAILESPSPPGMQRSAGGVRYSLKAVAK